MSATYDPSVSTLRDKLRFEIGDTDCPDHPLLQDEEYDYCISEAGSDKRRALALALWAIARQFARLADTEDGDLAIKAGERAKHYRQLAKDADAAADAADDAATEAATTAAPYAGGISASDVAAREGNSDRVPSAFGDRAGGMTYPYGPRSPWGW